MYIKLCACVGCHIAVPMFKSETDRPYDYNANVGDDVVFRCDAYAIPQASVVWYKNAVEIDRKLLASSMS